VSEYVAVLLFQLEDVTVALEGERSKFAAVDKKQRKFDQSLAEEKAISERLFCYFVYVPENCDVL